jgi:broad specificity phosphatase PhoE
MSAPDLNDVKCGGGSVVDDLERHFREGQWSPPPKDKPDPEPKGTPPKDDDAGPFTRRFTRIPPEWLDRSVRPPKRRYLLVREAEPGFDSPQRCERREWVGVLPRGRVAMVSAAGGTGKTFLMAQLAIAVAVGGRWLGAWQAQEPGRVLLALGEEIMDEVRHRLWDIANALDLTDEERALVIERVRLEPLAGCQIALTDERGRTTKEMDDLRAVLRREAGPEGWALVVLDPLSRLAGEKAEADNALATRLVQALEMLTEVHGNPTVVVSHHTSQGARQSGTLDATASRGVTGLTDGIRWQATIAPVKGSDQLTLHAGKTNYAPKAPDLTLIRNDDGVLFPAPPEARGAPGEANSRTLQAFVLAYVEANAGCSGDMIRAACRTGNGGPGGGNTLVDAARDALALAGKITMTKVGRREAWSVAARDAA